MNTYCLKDINLCFSNGHVAFDSFTRAFNQLHDGERVPLDRRLFERLFIIHGLVEFQLFMGNGELFHNQPCAFLPRNPFSEIDNFIMRNYDHFYKTFVQFWSTHKVFHPCKSSSKGVVDDDLCSTAMICDGHMKIRRRLCSNPNVPLHLPLHFDPLFNELIVGCCHSPRINGQLCESCERDNTTVEKTSKRPTKKQMENTQRKLKNWMKRYENDMTTVSVSRENSYFFFMNVNTRVKEVMSFDSRVDDIVTISAKTFRVFFQCKIFCLSLEIAIDLKFFC